jgi:hypothetical protein
MRKKSKRFTISLSQADHKKLLKIAARHKPPFTLQYLVNWSIQGLLEREKDPQLYLSLGNPLKRQEK